MSRYWGLADQRVYASFYSPYWLDEWWMKYEVGLCISLTYHRLTDGNVWWQFLAPPNIRVRWTLRLRRHKDGAPQIHDALLLGMCSRVV